MAAVGWLRYAHWAYFSQPQSDRALYRLVKRHRVGRIVEVGITRLERSSQLIRVAERYAPDGQVSYTGLDWFDARSADLESLTLKQAHAHLQATRAKIRLVPGEPARSLMSVANAHQHTGLLLISAAVSDSSLLPAWFYVPRMLDGQTVVLRERVDEAGETQFESLSAERIETLVGATSGRRAA